MPRTREIRRRLATIAAVLAVTGGVAAAPASATASVTSTAGADTVRFWNEVTMSAIATAAVAVPAQPLYLTYVHRAVYDGVRKAVERHASAPAAATAAAHAVLVHHFPAQQATLDQKYAEALATVPDDRARRKGLTTGLAAADRLLRARANDGLNGTPLPLPAPGPGVWVPTPPNTVGLTSWLGAVRPFTLRSPSQFRPPAPPALTSRRWATDYAEVRAYGSATSTARTAAQTEAARFWADPPYVQNQRALRAYTEEHGMSAVRTARLFALVDAAAADALIACWDAKHAYHFWRPFSAIPAGDTDGNPATAPDPAWQPLLATPKHPEYPSAHGCATTAMFTVLAGLTGTRRLDIDLDSTITGTTHHYATLGDLLAEVGDARIWGGLHWRFSTDAGVRLGGKVAGAVLRSW
jgi:hypothetical protein